MLLVGCGVRKVGGVKAPVDGYAHYCLNFHTTQQVQGRYEGAEMTEEQYKRVMFSRDLDIANACLEGLLKNGYKAVLYIDRVKKRLFTELLLESNREV